jgi:ankyrin repeat protein
MPEAPPPVQQVNTRTREEPLRVSFGRRRSHRRTDNTMPLSFYDQVSSITLNSASTPQRPHGRDEYEDKDKENASHNLSSHDDRRTSICDISATHDEHGLTDDASRHPLAHAHDKDNPSPMHSFDDQEEDFAHNPLPYEDMVNPTTELLCAISSLDWNEVMDRIEDSLQEALEHDSGALPSSSSPVSEEIRRWGHVTVRGQPVRLLPLQLACTQNPPVNVVQALLVLDATTKRHRATTADCSDRNGRVALHWACDANGSDSQVIRFLIDANPSACRRQEDKYGFLPLHIACFRHDSEDEEDDANSCDTEPIRNSGVAKQLDLSAVSSTRDSSVRERFSPGVVKALLDSYPEGAAVKDDTGWMPLHLVCRTNPDGEPLVRLLLDAHPEGATVRDRDGRLPLHWACCHRFSRMSGYDSNDLDTEALDRECARDPAESMLELLLEIYPDGVRKRERNYGFLPLHIACASGASLGVIQRLLDAFPDAAKKQDKNGSLPVHIACRANASILVIRSLLDAFPDGAQFQDADCRLPLHWACHVGASEPTISALLEPFPEGAQLTEAKYGYLPLHVACKRGAAEDVIASLLAAFPEAARTRDDTANLPLHIACGAQDITEAVIGLLLLAFPESLERTDQHGLTPLMLAQGNDTSTCSAITGLLQSQPSGWRDLAFPIKLKFLDLGHNPALEQDVMLAIQRDQEENKNSLLSTEITSDDDQDSDLEDGHWGLEDAASNELEASDDDQQRTSQVMKCVVCLNKPVSHILYPCGHACLCEECVENHIDTLNNICPVGRCPFHDAIRVYGTIMGD